MRRLGLLTCVGKFDLAGHAKKGEHDAGKRYRMRGVDIGLALNQHRHRREITVIRCSKEAGSSVLPAWERAGNF